MMGMKKYSGACHCRAVLFNVELDLSDGTMRCNCSYCGKARAWFAIVAPNRFQLLAGESSQQHYEWAPDGRDVNLHYCFCQICGVRTPGYGDHGPSGEPFVFVPVALLDNAEPNDLAASLTYIDGKHDHYDRQPEDVRLL